MSDYGLATRSWDMASHNSATIESRAASTSPTISAARDKTRILLEADELVTRNNLHDFRDLIRKGALLADDPHDYARVDNLTPDEIAALDEDEGKLLAVPITWMFYGLVGLL
ncbi:hypothetical protein BP00DRAFT_392541 [Aspergillus indologenus CBS 114.80]|uniref:Uncharacterized protein n=1 Tax=Aspergillus indologenus CBS 114.80 TaxID=1450541 RepID=A0A2V5I9W9_9EURO|nr:hypothetical protein BP00DRAFT_392541 [Aspergillus indologenus CBS 114.80]